MGLLVLIGYLFALRLEPREAGGDGVMLLKKIMTACSLLQHKASQKSAQLLHKTRNFIKSRVILIAARALAAALS